MDFQRITSFFDRRLRMLWPLMEKVFPRAERRDAKWHQCALDDEDFTCCYLSEDGQFIGLACYWVSERFVYLEHLAIADEMRGQGYGSAVLKQLQRNYAKLNIIAEVEPPVNEQTHRRCTFYEKNGFLRLPDEHVQLPYHPDTSPVPLLLYAYTHVNEDEIRRLLPRFERYLRERVMVYRDADCHP